MGGLKTPTSVQQFGKGSEGVPRLGARCAFPLPPTSQAAGAPVAMRSGMRLQWAARSPMVNDAAAALVRQLQELCWKGHSGLPCQPQRQEGPFQLPSNRSGVPLHGCSTKLKVLGHLGNRSILCMQT